MCRSMLQNGLVHFIASDVHSPQGQRGVQFQEAVAIAAELVGLENALQLVKGNLEYVIRGAAVPLGRLPEQASEAGTAGVWQAFKKHFIK